jgi:hypothetical protein
MKRIKKTHFIWLAVILAAWYTTRAKTVQWEEEVPLNTGETIWVTRTVTYSLKGDAGNPFDISYKPDWPEKLEFKWGDKEYVYKGAAALMLLAISPQNQPVLVAPAADKSWDWDHEYRCTVPHYVQFVPDGNGDKWTWPPQIEPWLYGFSANLMRQRRKQEEMQSRYTSQKRNEEDAIMYLQDPISAKIDPTFTDKDCKKGN